MIFARSHTVPLLIAGALAVTGCGGGSGSDSFANVDVDESQPEQVNNDVEAVETPIAPEADVTDPIYHHVSAEAPPNSFGPWCNAANVRPWAPGWRITAPDGWTHASSSGSNSYYELGWNTPDGFFVEVAWTESIDSRGFTTGTPVRDIDFDGETVALSDSSDDVKTTLSIDFIAQSAGGLVDALGGGVALNQISITAPAEMGMSEAELTAILTTMQRERCAILDALPLENAFQLGVVLPMFDGGDPLGKTPPTSARLPFEAGGALNPAAAYTDDQLAYIVGFDQATSECFVANVRPMLPTEPGDVAALIDPITPDSEEALVAHRAVLANC